MVLAVLLTGDRYRFRSGPVEMTDIAEVRAALEEASALLARLELAWCIDHTLYDGPDVEVWCSTQYLPAIAALDRLEPAAAPDGGQKGYARAGELGAEH